MLYPLISRRPCVIPPSPSTVPPGPHPRRPRICLVVVRPIEHGERPRKRVPNRPILEPSQMPLKHGVNHQLIRIRALQQGIGILVRPIQTQRRGERHKEILKRKDIWRGVVANQAFAHQGERQVVDPGRVGVVQLGGARADELGQTVVVVGRRVDLPAHDEEHHVQGGDALGELRDGGEGVEDLDEDLGQGVGFFQRVEQGGDARVAGADDFLRGKAFGGALAALLEEVEEEVVEGTGWGAVFNGDGVVRGRGGGGSGGGGGGDGVRVVVGLGGVAVAMT